MKVLNLLTAGGIGGIERLCLDIGRYSDFDNGFCFLTHDGPILEQMRSDGMTVHDLTAMGKKFSFRKVRELVKIARDYDIITVHHGDPFLKFYFLLLKPLRKKMVTEVHSCFHKKRASGLGRIKQWIRSMVYQMAFSVSDKAVFVSKAGMESYRSYFKIPESKCHIIYNGISTEKLVDGKDHVISDAAPYNITYIGRLSEIKGIDLLLKAACQLREKWPIELHIVGDGADRNKLENLCDSLEIRDITHFHGSQMDVAPYLRQASVFVYPSRCQEVFGISIVEAMAYGLPCVASNVGGIPEVIEDGVSGYLFRSEDVGDLADKLERVLQNMGSSQMNQMSCIAQKKAADFSIECTVAGMKELYESIYRK